MTAIVIGLLSLSVGAALSVNFGAVIVGEVLMGFGLFAGIKGLLYALIDTLQDDGRPEPAFVRPAPSRPALRPAAHLGPRPPQVAALHRYAAAR